MGKVVRVIILIVFVVALCGLDAIAQENRYTIKNNSDVEVKVSAWFTNAIQAAGRNIYGENRPSLQGIMYKALPVPDFQIILQPQEVETIVNKGGHLDQNECLAYLVAEYRVIPTIALPIGVATSVPADLFLVGRRFWAHNLPGLCGSNNIEINYDPATYLKFTIKINEVEDYFEDVAKS